VKVLILTNEYPPHVYGGGGVHVEYLSRELAKLMPVEVRTFGAPSDQPPGQGSLKVRGYSVPLELLGPSTPAQLRSALGALGRCVAWNADPIDADVVHCHTWYASYGGILAKLLYGAPLVITAHSLEPLRPWKREQLGRGYDVSCWVERSALEMADAIIAVSQGMRADILRLFNVEPERVHVIPNGIDTDEYRPTRDDDALVHYGIPLELPYVLFVGRIARQKGIIHLVRAIRHLRPELGVVLCAGQPDTPEIAAEMQARVAEVQRDRANVHWIQEMVPRRAAIQLYSHARVFCCPSIYEPFGIINLEAMACGTPVVASAVGGIREVIENERSGLLVAFPQESESPFEPLDPEQFARDLAAAINRVAGDDSLRRSLAEAGLRRAREVYSWRTVASLVHDLYRRQMPSGSPSPRD
jgi:alpha-maltose-1-phosphate synthase